MEDYHDMNIYAESGDKVMYMGCTCNLQAFSAGTADPRAHLADGTVYEVEYVDVGGYASAVKLKGIDGTFNTVCFKDHK